MSHNNWVLGIEEEIRNAPYYKILWGIIFLLSGFVVFVLSKRPNIIGEIPEIINVILLILFFIALVKYVESPKNPEYLAYYLYKIGENLPDFENEKRFLKKNKHYLKNCDKQISYLRDEYFKNSEYFIGNIIEFFNNLDDLIIRLNYLYSFGNEDETIMTRLMGMSSEQYITEKEFVSKNFMDLANLIYKEHLILIPDHVNITHKILGEIDYIPKKQFEQSLSEYLKKIWNKQSYNKKCLVFSITFFVISLIILSQVLIHFEQEQSYSTAMLASAGLTAGVLARIDWFITR